MRGRMIVTCREPSLIIFSKEMTKEEKDGLDRGSSSQHCCISSNLKIEICVTNCTHQCCDAPHCISGGEAFRCWWLASATWKQYIAVKESWNQWVWRQSLNAALFVCKQTTDRKLVGLKRSFKNDQTKVDLQNFDSHSKSLETWVVGPVFSCTNFYY